ncbi:glycoside hydrolase family 20 protein [Piloderma croceum F 1598]|uniref:Beta-hexosaminidase n=1 Tax=Piloderma croceum (strain F 1598) TaxID=765440 RepID=A0A0C3FEL5_PILCF|nr:glycoside hydrolase family 20 protein [Piloderma croceum F 1598]
MAHILALILTALVVCSPAFALWPLPKDLQTGSKALRLADDFDIQLSVQRAPADLQAAVARTKGYLKTDKLQRLVVGRGENDRTAIKSAKELSSLTVSLTSNETVRSISEEAMDALEDRVETYSLTVPGDGSDATLKANSTLGLFRGLTTFGQLWYEFDDITYTLEAPIQIKDAPAYPYRGFMLDTARNYFPISDIMRTLDAMSWVKINTFHWHIVDSQSFPLEVSGFTEISGKGAYSATDVYTSKDVEEIVSYAAARGIDVMVEVDTPGHTDAIGQSHPEHIACNQGTPWATFANEPPAGQLRFTNTATVNFTTDLIAAVAKMFPSKYFSTGGDELNEACYAADTQTQQELNATGKTLEQALSTFTVSTHQALLKLQKTPVVWEEMVLAHNVTLSNTTIVMVWISSDDVVAVAKKGYRFIHAASDYFYLDCGAGGWVGANPSGNSWCDPFKTWQFSYSFDPTGNLTTEESKLVMGGEHLLWTEQSNQHNLDPIVWPRAASGAELFWTGPGKNISTALPRLHDVAFRMEQRGIGTIPLQPLWCALRPGTCDLTA